jgi:hypothetical protein
VTCVYCGSPGPYTDEHVLTRAFAGGGEDWVLRNLVCDECNGLFSTYERAWTSAPGEAIARIFWGPAGRSRKGQAYQVHPSENVFLIANNDPLAYEVDILRGIEPRLRAQMISTPTGLITRAGDAADAERLTDATNAFWKERAITIQKRRKSGPKQFRIAILSMDGAFRVERIEWRAKPTTVWLDHFPYGVNISSDTRMSVDAHGRLRFRARKIRDITRLLALSLQKPVSSRPAGGFAAGTYQVVARSPYDPEKVFRAMAKTIVNYAIDEFGPTWIASPTFRPILDYCLGRIGDPPNPFVGLVNGPTGIDAIDDAPPERHALALCSDGKLIIGLVRLYRGPVYRVHLGPAPNKAENFVRSIQIDYNGPGRVRGKK